MSMPMVPIDVFYEAVADIIDDIVWCIDTSIGFADLENGKSVAMSVRKTYYGEVTRIGTHQQEPVTLDYLIDTFTTHRERALLALCENEDILGAKLFDVILKRVDYHIDIETRKYRLRFTESIQNDDER